MAAEGFPNHPIFKSLVESVTSNDGVIIHDPANGIYAGYARFLNDVLALRRAIREQIPDLLDPNGIVRDERVYICTLAPASYEFFVATFAIWAIGAILSPLASGIKPKEATYVIEQTNTVLLIHSAKQRDAANEIQQCMQEESRVPINTIGIDITIPIPSAPCKYHVDESTVLREGRAMLLTLTSGTTGPPKGVIRSFAALNLRAIIPTITSNDLAFCHRSVHWGYGLIMPVSMIVNGMAIYLTPADPSPEEVWSGIRQKKFTMIFSTSLIFLRLMQHYNDHLAGLEPEVLQEYRDGVANIKYVTCGGAVPVPSVGQFWKDIRGGQPITIIYGTSETGGSFATTPEGYDVTQRVIGKPLRNTHAKIVNGELLIKSNDMLIGYLNNEAGTRSVLDENGFCKTGDLVHILEDGNYVIDGRVRDDFILSRSLKVGTLELEDRLTELPYIAEAAVVAVPDIEIANRVAVVARLKPEALSNGSAENGRSVDLLYKIRQDLTAMKVALYKLPTLLRVLKNDEGIPRTYSDKTVRKKVLQAFFPLSADCKVEDLPKEVLVWDLKKDRGNESTSLWDWAGTQD